MDANCTATSNSSICAAVGSDANTPGPLLAERLEKGTTWNLPVNDKCLE
jgi:hypothetical protein